MTASITLSTKAGVKIAVNAVVHEGGGGGVTAHADLTGLTTGDDHTQYQRSEAFYTSSASYTVTDQSLVITAGSAITLPDAQGMAGRVVGVGAAAQTVTISPAGTDTMWDDPGNSYSLPSGNGIAFVSVQIGGGWGWAVYTRNGPAFDMPKWFAQSLTEGKVLRIDSTGTPAWASVAAADVPNLAASKITSGTFDVARLATGTASSSVFLRGDGTWATASDSGALQKASNLSDLGSASTARTNLGLGTAATANTGTGSSNVILGNDSRLTDARVPQWRRLTFSDANYDLSATPSPAVSGSVFLQQTGTITATRTVTLPAASACPAGSEVIVNAGAGVTTTNTVTVQRSGSDTINGASTSVVIGTAYGQRRFVSDGVSAWAYDDGLVRRSQNLADVASASTALSNLGAVPTTRTVNGSALSADITISAAPSGSAGGDLTGTYPNPTIGAGKVTNSQLSATLNLAPVYGNGADGDVTISGTTTLTGDAYYNNLTVTGTLITGNYRVFVAGTLSGNGNINCNGASVTTSNVGGNSIASAVYLAAGNGGNSTTGAGAQASAVAQKLGGNGGAGGAGSGGAGGTAQTGTANVAAAGGTNLYQDPFAMMQGRPVGSVTTRVSGGAGGGAGGGDGTNFGAGGGAGGGIVFVAARATTFTGSITATGGGGGTRSTGNVGGGGGGGGGVVVVVTGSTTQTFTVSVAGGSGGSGTGTGSAGSSGTSGASAVFLGVK